VSATFRPRAFLVDLDNTLHDYNGTAREARAEMAARIETEFHVPRHRVLARYEELVAEDAGREASSARELRTTRLERMLETWPETRDADASTFAALLEQALIERIRPFPGAIETFRSLEGQQPTLIITEGFEDMQAGIAARLGLPVTGRQFLATRIHGVRKSDSTAYRLAIEWLGIPPESILMIGDNWSWDVIASSRVGMWQVWVNLSSTEPEPPPRQYLGRVSSFCDVSSLLTGPWCGP
jgi:putative hydrolase of the HAD superfamily